MHSPELTYIVRRCLVMWSWVTHGGLLWHILVNGCMYVNKWFDNSYVHNLPHTYITMFDNLFAVFSQWLLGNIKLQLMLWQSVMFMSQACSMVQPQYVIMGCSWKSGATYHWKLLHMCAHEPLIHHMCTQTFTYRYTHMYNATFTFPQLHELLWISCHMTYVVVLGDAGTQRLWNRWCSGT